MTTLTTAETQSLRADIGDYAAPLILSNAQLQTAWDRADSSSASARVYALFHIVSRFTRDRDPRLKDYQALLELWQKQANMTAGQIETGVIDLDLIEDLRADERYLYGPNPGEF